jgi:hypothetical protein
VYFLLLLIQSIKLFHSNLLASLSQDLSVDFLLARFNVKNSHGIRALIYRKKNIIIYICMYKRNTQSEIMNYLLC